MEITITNDNSFTTADFPPVALLNEKTDYLFISKIKDYLRNEDGVNINPMLLESFISFYEFQQASIGDGTFISTKSLFKKVSEENSAAASFFIEQKLISEDFLTHCLRFSQDINKIIDWALILSAGKTNKPLTIIDGYYLTSIFNSIKIPTYQKFLSLTEASGTKHNRVPFDKLYAYNVLNKALHSKTSGTVYSDKDMFTVASLYSSEDIISFINNGHSLLHIILFYRLGLTTAEEVLENGHTIPREWLEVVKSQYV